MSQLGNNITRFHVEENLLELPASILIRSEMLDKCSVYLVLNNIDLKRLGLYQKQI